MGGPRRTKDVGGPRWGSSRAAGQFRRTPRHGDHRKDVGCIVRKRRYRASRIRNRRAAQARRTASVPISRGFAASPSPRRAVPRRAALAGLSPADGRLHRRRPLLRRLRLPDHRPADPRARTHRQDQLLALLRPPRPAHPARGGRHVADHDPSGQRAGHARGAVVGHGGRRPRRPSRSRTSGSR